MAVGLHRLDGHAGRHARRRRAVRRQPLLGAGRGRAGRQRHRAGEDPTPVGAQHIDWLAQHVPRGAHGRGRRQRARPGRRAPAARARSSAAASGCAPTSTCSPRVWPERPARRPRAVYEHRAPQAPRVARATKLGAVREAMARGGATHHFVSTVDDIAWILNLRGADVSYNPVFLAHLLLDARRGDAVRRRRQGRRARCARALAADGVRLAPYDSAGAALAALPAERDAAARPEARDARRCASSAAGAGWSRRSTRARCSRAARATPRPRTCATRWPRTARRCASSTPGSRRRSPTGARERDHRADDRREAQRGARAGGPASSA